MNCDKNYCALSVMSNGEVYTWRAVSITCCDVGNMAIGYVAFGAITYCDADDMAIGYVACGGITYCDVGDMAMEYVKTTSGT
jgi:hypothetical protein